MLKYGVGVKIRSKGVRKTMNLPGRARLGHRRHQSCLPILCDRTPIPGKRIELHLHTKMSAFDGVGTMADYCAAAKGSVTRPSPSPIMASPRISGGAEGREEKRAQDTLRERALHGRRHAFLHLQSFRPHSQRGDVCRLRSRDDGPFPPATTGSSSLVRSRSTLEDRFSTKSISSSART